MAWSRRIALPLAIALHILLFALLNKPMRISSVQAAGHALTVRLIPLLVPRVPVAPVPTSEPPVRRREAASSSSRKESAPQSPPHAPTQETATLATPTQATEVPKESTSEGKPALTDPAALVNAYSYEDSKSYVQKAIESHGGTVALTKGKYDDFHDQMKFAAIPDCVNPDGLKHDPPKIGPIAIGGLPALLFLAHAAATGKCKLPGAN
jgi:hypothetical protein